MKAVTKGSAACSNLGGKVHTITISKGDWSRVDSGIKEMGRPRVRATRSYQKAHPFSGKAVDASHLAPLTPSKLDLDCQSLFIMANVVLLEKDEAWVLF